MKKFLFWFLLILAIASAAYFIGYPYISEKFFSVTGKEKIDLQSPDVEAANSFIKEGWIEPEVIVYQRRNMPDIEADFYAKGYPQFMYDANPDGSINLKSEKSFHEDGMGLHLTSDDAGYLTGATIDYGVNNKFGSTYMSENIPPLLDFIVIITGHEVSEEDQKALLRLFSILFNDPGSKNNRITINGLQFTVSLDVTQKLIILSC